MTKDRLAEFRRKAHITPEVEAGDTLDFEDEVSIVQMGVDHQNHVVTHHHHHEQHSGNQDIMKRFFLNVEELRNILSNLKTDVKRVKNLNDVILSQPIPDERKKQELDSEMVTIKSTALFIRSKLKDMQKSMDQNQANVSPAFNRIKKTQHAALMKEFLDIMYNYQSAEMDYRDRCKERIKRQLDITKVKYTDNDVEHMIEDGNMSALTKWYAADTEEGKKMLQDARERRNDILKLEKSLKELHELFDEIALLVESQGEVVDRIETHVNQAKEYTGQAKTQLREAEVYQTKARKKALCIVIIIIVATILAILGILVYLKANGIY